MTNNERAMQLWSLLVLAARNQQILSYALVERLTGIPKVGLGKCLDPIYQYCQRHNLPPLTSVVVSEKNGLPTGNWIEAKDIFGAQARVFVYDWLSQKAPKDFSS